MTGPRIDGRTWCHDGLLHRSLVLEPTVAGDDVVTLWVADGDAGLTLCLSPVAADEVADSLRQRAGLLHVMTGNDSRELRCTWCGLDELAVDLAWSCPGPDPICEIAGFHCRNEHCGAEWEPDGTIRESGQATRERVS